MVLSWFTRVRGRTPATTRRPRFRPQVEGLEERLVPALAVTDLTTPGVTPTTLVNTLTGGSKSVAVSNVSYTGNNVAAGTFTGGNGILGFDSGVVLSTGTAQGIIGPNNTGGFTGAHPPQPGDAQLTALAGVPTFDASVLQFDITPTGNVLSFQYVFGSEEYNEFVNANFNDAFGFFLNGQNISLIPGTNTPVSIHTVNLNTNSQFYINNAPAGDPNPAPGPLLNTQLDGLTVVLSAVVSVNPGQTYHVKLAIANAVDHQLDSDVMIKAGSFDVATVHTFHPLRYIEQLPPAGTPAGKTSNVYNGNITLDLITNQTITAPLFIFIPNLPPGVTVVNPSGTTGSGAPFIAVPGNQGLSPSNRVVRIPITLSDPQQEFMSTFLLGYTIDVTGLPAIQ